jgi:hypothetical protein
MGARRGIDRLRFARPRAVHTLSGRGGVVDRQSAHRDGSAGGRHRRRPRPARRLGMDHSRLRHRRARRIPDPGSHRRDSRLRDRARGGVHRDSARDPAGSRAGPRDDRDRSRPGGPGRWAGSESGAAAGVQPSGYPKQARRRCRRLRDERGRCFGGLRRRRLSAHARGLPRRSYAAGRPGFRLGADHDAGRGDARFRTRRPGRIGTEGVAAHRGSPGTGVGLPLRGGCRPGAVQPGLQAVGGGVSATGRRARCRARDR